MNCIGDMPMLALIKMQRQLYILTAGLLFFVCIIGQPDGGFGLDYETDPPHIQLTTDTSMQDTVKNNFVISGTITMKKEIWDRRPNPEMGMPDILKEIIFRIQIDSVISGNAPDSSEISVSAKNKKLLIKCGALCEGGSAIFTVYGNKIPFELMNVDSLSGKAGCVPKKNANAETATKGGKCGEEENNQPNESLNALEEKGGKEMRGSKVLQEKAVRIIAKKYGMKNAEFITRTTFSGPRPPQGGYILWGVRGQIKSKWYVWQPGYNDKLREGKKLHDPHKYQK